MCGMRRRHLKRCLLLTAAATAVACASCAAALAAPAAPVNDPFYSYTASLAHIGARDGAADPGTGCRSAWRARRRHIRRRRCCTGPPTSSANPAPRSRRSSRRPAPASRRPSCSPTRRSTTASRHLPAVVHAAGRRPRQHDRDGGRGADARLRQQGYTVVTSDRGRSRRLGRPESGYATLDAIRAAEHELKLSAGSTPVGLVGYSGGSIASEWASELASAYAPELHLIGVAEGGIPADFIRTTGLHRGSSELGRRDPGRGARAGAGLPAERRRATRAPRA